MADVDDETLGMAAQMYEQISEATAAEALTASCLVAGYLICTNAADREEAVEVAADCKRFIDEILEKNGELFGAISFAEH